MNAGFYNSHNCKDCKHWRQFPANEKLGECKILPILHCDRAQYIALMPASDYRENPEPTRDIENLRTTGDFGCINFDKKINR